MKLLIFSDIHVHEYRPFDNNGSRLETCLMCLNDILQYAALNCDAVVFAGDLVDPEGSPPAHVLNRILDVLNGRTISQYYISGNHDQSKKSYGASDISILNVVCDENYNRKLIDCDYVTIDDVFIGGVQYMSDPNVFYAQVDILGDCISEHQKSILFIHQAPHGLTNIHIPTNIDPNHDVFSRFDHIFCGHIHEHQKLTDKFTIIGSPLHRDMKDLGQRKGFLIFDTDTMTYKRVETNYPEFRVVDSDPGDGEHYYLVRPELKDLSPNESNDILEGYENIDDRESILRAYWKEHGEQNDELLKIGLNLLK